MRAVSRDLDEQINSVKREQKVLSGTTFGLLTRIHHQIYCTTVEHFDTSMQKLK